MEFKTSLTDIAPTAANDSYTVSEDATLTVPAPGVLANDTDADPGTTLTALLVSLDDPRQPDAQSRRQLLLHPAG